MNFQVPQFIEVEDKIFGPLTFKQFLYLAGGAGFCFIEWVYLPYRVLAVLLIIPTALFASALAFYKVNERPFVAILEAAFRYLLSAKLFLWRTRHEQKPPAAAPAETAAKEIKLPRLSKSKLKDLAWSLDIKEKIQ